MGFLSNIINKITGKDPDGRSKNILDRIYQLQKFKSSQEKRLDELKKEQIDTSWFKIEKHESFAKVSTVFTPRKFGEVKTMKDLLEKRKREEEERIRQLKKSVNKSLDTVRSLIVSENAKQAEDLLYQIAPSLKQIKDQSIQETYDELKPQISILKETLRQREIERIVREAEEKAEHERIKREQRRLAEEKARREQEERERKAREYEEKLVREEQVRALEIARLTALVSCPKDNAQTYINHLKLHGVRWFYHFTDERNLQSIRKLGGLYSWYYCEQNGIMIPNPGGDFQSRGLDSRQGLKDYVRLSFCRDHPMTYRLKQEGASLVLLTIKIDVAGFKDTQFSDVNAAANNNSHGKDLVDLQRVNISATQRTFVSRNDGDIFYEHQAECMVKTFIPIEYIININNPIRI